jgi:hypothetical protein
MFYVLSILLGLCLGQHIKIAVSPELQAFFKASWAQAESKALPMAKTALGQIKTTVQKQVKRTKPDPQIQADLDLVEARFLQP